MQDWFSQTSFAHERQRRGATWGRPVRALARTTSTNDLALSACPSDAKTGIVWIAREQTHGRGRRGNRWQAPPGDSLLFSTLLRYPGPPTRLSGMSLVVGLAIRDAVLPFVSPSQHSALKVKWPNDLWAGDKKLAGILIETRSTGSRVDIVVGVGLNVRTEHFPRDLPSATSLTCLWQETEESPLPRMKYEALLATHLLHLEERLSTFFARGLPPFLEELSRHDALRGRTVDVEGTVGIACGFDGTGQLLVEIEPGHTVRLPSGHVQLVID